MNFNIPMDEIMIRTVRSYIDKHFDKSDSRHTRPIDIEWQSIVAPRFDVYIVWKCKALQNWKYLISTDLPDGMYYELTYNGDKDELYLDAYKKFDNQCIVL